MNRTAILEQIKKGKIVAILRGVAADKIVKTAEALADGGIRCMEIAISQTNADTVRGTMDSIRILKETFGEKVLLGAGTVLTSGQVEEATRAGATYIISPNFRKAVVRRTKEIGSVSIPGAFTASEAVEAYETGADIVKIFPAGLLGPAYIKALRGPLGHIPMMAVGGVNAQNIPQFLKAGVCSVGVGGNLVPLDAVNSGDFEQLRQTAADYVKCVRSSRVS